MDPETIKQLVGVASYVGGGLCMGFGAIGSAIGEGKTAGDAINGMSRQPSERDALFRMMLVGQALAESAGVFALVVAFLVMNANLGGKPPVAFAGALLGAGLSAGLGGIGVGIGCGMVSAGACAGLARQPETKRFMLVDMLLGQAMATTPSIFSLVVALFLLMKTFPSMEHVEAIKTAASHLGAGLCMGMSTIGPGVGLGFCGAESCLGMARRIESQPTLRRVFFIGSAVTQNMSVLAFIVAILLISK